MATKKSLEAAAATNNLFSEAKPEQQKKAVKTTPAEKNVKKEKAVFSVKIDADVVKKWRYYSSMDGYGDKGNLTEKALVEFMNRHKLPPEQQKKLDILMSI